MTATESQTEGVQLVTLRNLIGHTISGAYRIDRVIGEGGMGIVFEATQLKLDRQIALKVLKLDGPNAQEAFARFEREIAILSNLSHPNIVRVLDSGHDGGLDIYFIAMDMVSGKPLGDLSDGYRFAPALALELIYQIAGALAQPHNEGVIHRDLKPDNVLVEVVADETLQIRLVDFGIARAFSADKKLTATGVVVGTPHYMAPELVREKEMDRRTDIYALGVMLHELLTGTLPYDGGNFMQIGFKHVQAPIPSLVSKIDDLDMPDLENLVARMMAKEMDDRFDSVADLRRGIEKVIDDNGFPRVRVDPSLPIDAAIEGMRYQLDSHQKVPDSAEWVPQSTPQAGASLADGPRHAAEHKSLSTTTIEGVATSSMVPLIVALIAVAVALVAVLVAINVQSERPESSEAAAATRSDAESEEPEEMMFDPSEEVVEEVAKVVEAAEDTEVTEVADRLVTADAGASQVDAAESGATAETTKRPDTRPQRKVRTRPDKKTKPEDKVSVEEKLLEEGLDWVSGSD